MVSGVQDYLKELAGRWQARYDDAQEKLFVDPSAGFKEFIDFLWEYGVLGRIAPKDGLEVTARERLGRIVWIGGRNDPELYWRILYSAGTSLEAIRRKYSHSFGGYVGGIFGALYEATKNQVLAKQFLMKPGEGVEIGNDLWIRVLLAIEEKAREALRGLGQEPHKELIPWGAKGTWKGLRVEVDRYCQQGLIWFRVFSGEDHIKLWELNEHRGGGVLPSEVNPADFGM